MTTPTPGRPSPPWFRNGYLWASVLVVACVAAGVAWAASLVYGIGQSIDEGFDEFSSDGVYPYHVDQESVLDATEKPCERMLEVGGEVSPLPGSPQDAAAALRNVASVGDDIVAAIDSADPDADSRQWRDDWVAVVASIESYADAIESDGVGADYDPPLTEFDEPVVMRMQFSSDSGCEVPDGIIVLGPDDDYLD